MRTVLRNHSEVCHVWASQSQEIGRSGNISFDGPTIYSYRWWPMASFIEPNVVLYRDAVYSASTSSHQSGVRSAISHCTVFTVANLGGNHQENIAHYVSKARITADSFWSAQAYGKFAMDSYERIVQEARDYAGRFGCVDMLPPLFGLELSGPKAAALLETQEARKSEIDEARRVYWEQWQQRQDEVNKKRQRADSAFAAAHEYYRELWRDGVIGRSIELLGFTHYLQFDHPALRHNESRDEIETSMGAFVPAREAKVLYKMLQAGKQVRGHKIGHYTVISYNGCLKIGCHEIQRDEIDRLAHAINWA